MRLQIPAAMLVVLLGLIATEDSDAGRGGRGGGGRGGGVSRPSGGAISRPSGGAISRPSGGFSPSISPPAVSRPAPSLPKVGGGGSIGGGLGKGTTFPSPGMGDIGRPGALPGDGGLAGKGPAVGGKFDPGARPSAKDVGEFLGLPGADAIKGGLADKIGDAKGVIGDKIGKGGDRIDKKDGPIGKDGKKQLDPKTKADWAQKAKDHKEQIKDKAQDIRDNIGDAADDFFSPGWRARYPELAFARFHYNYPGAYWAWRATNWFGLSGWIRKGLAEPYYYDYGGGGVVYDDGYVYQDGVAVATEEEYATQAMTLANQGAEAISAMDPKAKQEWLPLGVFAVVPKGEGASEADMFLQLAVDKDGAISGTFYNKAGDKALPVQGQVDMKTQRASWFAGDKKNTVMETGLYNLTKEETEVLIHFGPEQTQTWLLVRLPEPKDKGK